MRRVLFFMLISLDGYFEGPNHDIDWHMADEEFSAFAAEQLDEVDLLLFGRTTFELMLTYWPTPAAMADDPVIAAKMTALPKLVFSTTLDRADWDNTRIVRGNLAEEIAALKRRPGKDMLIMGSSRLAASFADLGLIDEYRLIVAPVVLGQGSPLLAGLGQRLKLRLLKTRTFGSGNVLLYYIPER
jgi:dihydrofolate reductase